MSYFDSQGDENSTKQSLDSLILPPPPSSIYGDGPYKNKTKLNDDNSNDNIDSELTKSQYIRKTPDMFLTDQDAVDYYSFLQDINLMKEDENNKFDFDNLLSSLSVSDQKWRLLISFQRLYDEYSLLYEQYKFEKEYDKFQSKIQSVTPKLSDTNSNIKITKDSFCQTELLNDTISINDDSIISRNHEQYEEINIIKKSFLSPLKFGICLGNNCSKNIKTSTKLLITDNSSNENLEVYEIKQRKQDITTHQIYLHKSYNDNDKTIINIPIALELLIPKIQQKIEKIFEQCPFLCDPLEVVSELRNCNYNYKKCIEYFQITKHLRYFYSNPNNQIKSNDIKENLNNNLIEKQRIYKNVSFCNVSKINDNELIETNAKIDKFISTYIQTDNKATLMLYVNIAKILKTSKQIHKHLYDDVRYLGTQLNKVFDSLKIHMITVINQCSEKLVTNEQKLKLLALSRQNDELKLKLKEEEKKRRQVYNRMQEQMGNIRVYCRCRKLTDDENVLDYIGEDTLVLTTAANERFEFDKLFQPGVSQAELYDEFRPLVMSFIDGYNVCFITYGGEASGKTYTLIGENKDQSQQGIMQRSLTTILKEERLRQRDWEYKISACLVEIYNDNCIDVLSGEMGIQLYVDSGMETAYHKLKSVPITNEADADALIQVCTVKRKIARTALNPASSRSHLIILIRLQGTSKIHGENICSFLCLCDLAGFEDIIKAETQTNKILSKEAGYINRSLTAFNRVFVSLKKQDPNTVCYRDTKLTHLLKPFLTNSGKCALIVTVRNDKRSVGSTHNTLRFGKETRGVTLGKARRQVNISGNNNGGQMNNNPLNHHPTV